MLFERDPLKGRVDAVLVETQEELGAAHVLLSEDDSSDYHALPGHSSEFPLRLHHYSGHLILKNLSQKYGEHMPDASYEELWDVAMTEVERIIADPA